MKIDSESPESRYLRRTHDLVYARYVIADRPNPPEETEYFNHWWKSGELELIAFGVKLNSETKETVNALVRIEGECYFAYLEDTCADWVRND